MTDAPVIRVIDCHVAREAPEGYEFLLLRRAPNRADAGRWRIVTGKIEDGETAWQAALRELREETDLHPLRFFALPYVNQFYEWQHDRINAIPVFLAVVPYEAPITLDEEHVDSRWLPAPEAVTHLPWPGMRDGLLAAETLLTDRNAPTDLEIDFPPR